MRPVVRVDEGKQPHAVRPHEMLRRIPGKAGDPLADKADLPIRRVLALIGEAGKVVHQGFKLAAFLVQLHPDEHVVAFELLPEALVGDVGADAGQHFVGMERFGHIVDAADFEPPVLLAGRFHHGQEDHRDALGLFVRLEALADFEAVHLGHEDVQQDEIGVMAEGQIQRALSVLGDDEEIVLFEGLDQDVQIDGIVIHDQNDRFIGLHRKAPYLGRCSRTGKGGSFPKR